MRDGLKNMCEFYDSLIEMVIVFIYVVMYIILSINVYVLITFYFYSCRWNMEIWNEINSMKKEFQITMKNIP